ncbi:MAG: glycosyl hydrolase 2 galactose-binding domain-containing protein, partial [Pyrinomonadaceae bacterium]
MTAHRLFLLTLLLILTGGFQLGTIPDTVSGPYHGSFIIGGVGLKKPLNAESSPLEGDRAWSIYAWVKSETPAAARTLLAGFGEPEGAAGTQRYFAVRAGKVSFWTGNSEIQTETPLQSGSWQFLTATFAEGHIVLYSDGVRLASSKLGLAPAAPVIHLAPVPALWPDATHFAGRIAGFTLLRRALTPEEVRALGAQSRNLDRIAFEAASKSWPVQTKGQEGLRAPQEPATLPASLAEPSRPRARPIVDNRPVLAARGEGEWALSGGWRMIEAPKIAAEGAAISRPDFATVGWLDATVPGTVLSTYVDRGVYPDPDFGLNNLAIPETLSRQDYWYRTEFNPPASLSGRRLTLTLYGINYAASVWLNGKSLGEVRGAFMRGEFDVSAHVIPGRPNALAVRVSPPPHPGIPHEQSVTAGPGPNGGIMCLDGPTFICTEGWDWIPGVRDRAAGIWQEVTLKATGPVKIGDVHVVTDLPLPDTTRASVNLTVPLRNNSARPVSGVVEAAFEGVTVRRRVVIAPGGTEVRFTPADFPRLNLRNPRLWWPNGYGSPELYHLKVKFSTAGGESDSRSLRFGIRELSYELTLLDGGGRLRRVDFNPTVASAAGQHVVNVSHEGMIESAEGWVASFMPGAEASAAVRELADRRASPHLVLRVNGVRIACRGGNWGLDDSRKRISRERLEPYFRLHREANLNMIRNWSGQNTAEVFYELADEYGLLVWNDFWLSTQDWNLDPSDSALFLANARDTVSRFRHHPSVAIWCGRNEGVPAPTINEGLDALIRQLDGTRYYSPNSRDINLSGSGPWHYSDIFKFFTTRGRGFSTELGLPSPPPADTIRSMLAPADHWPPNDAWAYHDWHSKSGGDTTHFMKAMADELGAPVSLADFERKSQLLNYVSHRAMFEGFNANLWKPNSGRLMWMTHPAWPSMAWQMYSSDYTTYGAFYGIKKACEPLHVQLNLPGLETAVVNTTTLEFPNLRLSARMFKVDGEEIQTREEKVTAHANSTTESFPLELPEQAAPGVVFIKLTLADEAGRLLSENFYWHSSQAAGYRKLNDLSVASVDCTATRKDEWGMVRVRVELANRSGVVALASQVTLRDARSKARVLPSYASDNFVSLLPGESRRLSVEVPASAAGGDMEVALTGWNVQSLS